MREKRLPETRCIRFQVACALLMPDTPAAVDFAVAEVFGHGLVADFGHGIAFGHGGFELEAAQVVGEVKRAAGFEQLHGFADKAGMVALDVEDIQHFFAVGKRRRG